jgi:hypothetical protein
MDRAARNTIERATQQARKLLDDDFSSQLEGTFDIFSSGKIAEKGGPHLSAHQAFQREKIVAAIEHKRATGMTAAEAVTDYVRDAAFTTINRFVALKMLEARDLVQECITKGDQSTGYREFCGLASGLALLPEAAGYRLYIESLFDELSTEVKVLFDRHDPASVLWPRRQSFEALLDVFNNTELSEVWGEDETIGWVYQYFNSSDERREMRESHAPKTGRDLAVRNQFFTPRYVVEFLVQNTLGALWIEMTDGQSPLRDLPLLIPRVLRHPRTRKDPRDIRVLDPACGSGHFLLCSFDVLASIYRESWADNNSPKSLGTNRSLREDFPTITDLERDLPRLILENNLYGIDIDARCAQIAALALWMRAQRAWNESDLPRGNRPAIVRTNIVIAEPIPAGRDTREAFMNQLEPDLRRVADALFRRLDLAGEAGSLLEIHEWFRLEIRQALGDFGELFAQSDQERWRKAEVLLLEKLRAFAVEANSRTERRRSLFVADAMRGLAFVDVTRETFDVVLMNPPFGDPTPRAREGCGNELAAAANDIGGAFVLAAKRRWAPEGCIGVLSSTTLWFKPTVADWRRETLLDDAYAIRAAAHFGGDVLDGATVSASATIIDRVADHEQAVFVRLLFEVDKASRLLQAVSAFRAQRHDELVFQVRPAEFRAFRGAPLAYWISEGLRSRLASLPPLEGNGAEVRQGVATADDFRFVLAWWEVPIDEIGLKRSWAPYAKGSEYSPYWDDITWVIRWENDGREVRAFERAYPRSTSYFGRAGVTYPARSVLGFNPRAFPVDIGFSNMGSVAFPLKIDARALLGYLASRPLEYVLSFSNGSLQGKKGAYPNHYEVGQVKDLPWPEWRSESLALLESKGDVLATAAMRLQLDDETTHQYGGRPGLASRSSAREIGEESVRRRAALVSEMRIAREHLDRVVASELGFDSKDIEEMLREFARCENATTGPWSPSFGEVSADVLRVEAEHLVSELFGFAIGRLDIRPAMSGTQLSGRTSAFEPLPSGNPAILRNVPADYPISVPTNGVLVLDTGSDRDIERAVRRVTTAIWADAAMRMEQELAALLGYDDIRSYFARTGQGGFFGRHLTRYAKSRRVAPIYWNIGTTSGAYTVFLHYPKLQQDTIFVLLHDFIEPKIAHDRRLLDDARRDAGSNPTALQRRDLATKQTLIDELSTFADELKHVAPLWKPNLSDGAMINFALLWRLVPHHRPWQKELKAMWDDLCGEKYEWAHLAMHLWPERVVPKCATDRSLAIAHGLEDVFWVEGDEGKWKPRHAPGRAVDDLVRERASIAVKAALKTLVEAPVATNGGRGRSRRAANATFDLGARDASTP